MNDRVYTYDVWDTILRRNCTPSYTLKLTLHWLLVFLGEKDRLNDIYTKIKNEEKKRFNQKEEYFIDEIVFSVLMDNEFIDLSRKSEIFDIWNSIYFFVEKNCTYKNDKVIKLIEEDLGEKFFISDFYTDSEFIKKLFLYHGIDINSGVTSAEYDASKNTGMLYKKLSFIRNKRWIHTGDNKLADVKMAKLEGASVRYIKNDKIKKYRRNGKNDFKRLAEIMLSFSFFILMTANKEKCKKIYFFTREGVFFKRVFDLFLEYAPNIFNTLHYEVLPTSRVASLALRLDESDDFFGFKDALTQYGYEISTFLSFFNLQDKHYELENKYLDIRDVFLNRDDPEVLDLIRSIADKKKRAESFLDNIGFNIEPAIVVDIGWRGSIQDNLMSVGNRVIKHGCYLGLFNFYEGQSDRYKSSLIFNNNINPSRWSKKGVAFMETIFNAVDGSVVDYKGHEPIRKSNNIEDYSAKRLMVMQSSILSEFRKLLLELKQGRLNVENIDQVAVDSYKKIVTNPSKEIADFYLESIQNETFGKGMFIEKEFDVKLKDVLYSLFSKEKKNEIKLKIHNNGWRESILKSSKISIYVKLYSFFLR